MTWYTGYSVFKSKSGPAGNGSGDFFEVNGISPEMQWVVTDSAYALAMSAAALAAAALAF
jgi:hypothetical protein